ncbi:PREDICTED: glutamic acid-rich protein isoform X1 [Theobroma cacao]|uniref:Glutamic acid-rich protein isoform X1 n=1 Tax=Theobroma cacao TaxID=3641 RepID=A0AB32UV89_THECC|nr:PREDICTED: glutamic acid-rich protein isoform X1 [Theobroma cacao]
MAEEVDDSLAPETDAKEAVEPTAASEDIESRITTAMRSRVGHFKEQADSLTFEGVRRLLEKDLGLETFALDVHKRFVKQCLLKCLDGGDDDDAPKSSGETGEKNLSTTTEVTESPKGRQSKKDVKEAFSEDEEKLEDSPVLGLLTGHKTTKTETMETETKENKDVFESTIKKAIKKRASYVEANSEKVTMAGLRRLLEEDLKLDKDTLDPYKKFITEQLDEVLKSREVSAPASVVKKNNLKKNSQSKASKKASKKLSSASSGSESDEEEGEEEEDEDEDEDEDEEEEEEVKPKKKISAKGKIKNSEGLKKRKIPKKEAEMPSKKRSKHAESISDDNSDAEDSGSVSDDNRSRSSAAKAVKRKETSTPVYGKHVEHLKSVIKSCGMSVPPAIYKRVKQVPENNREAQLIKELEEILSKEGLSSNPSEKEIKEVRKRKERAKELEGIDTSNIVLSSRRRSTTSFVAPPKPKIPDASDDDESEESDDNDDDDDGDEDNDDEDGGDEGNSQSEGSDEEADEDSD